MIPKVEVEPCKLIDNTYQRNGYTWTALSLIEAAKDYEPFDMPLAGLNLSGSYWGIENLNDFVYHAKRVQDVDAQYPIILDDQGSFADGVHRIVKAILAGKETIKAIRLQKMPGYDSYVKPEL